MTESLLQQARKHRELVLLAELAGWLHDLGKLSSEFLRQHLDEQAYNAPGGTPTPPQEEEQTVPCEGVAEDKWYHFEVLGHDLKDDKVPEHCRNALQTLIEQRHLTGDGGWIEKAKTKLGTERVGLWQLVSRHHRGRGESREQWLNSLLPIQRLLVRADRDDSGEDEYNAVELPQREPMQAGTVFGREMPLAAADLDQKRLELYPALEEALRKPGAPAANRGDVWGLLQQAMQYGLGKTQRAANDVRLDQHVWAVTSRFKAFFLRDLVRQSPADEKDRGKFRLLSIWWNSWEAITPFARLSDVVGRKVMLDRLRQALRQAIEGDYALGNRVYEDDDGVHFLVADLPWDLELTGLVRGIVNQATDGEVQPVVRLSKPTERVTDLVEQMEAARKEMPLVGDPAWAWTWPGSTSRQVCPVCQQRPLEQGRDLCQWCEGRRGDGIEQRLAREGTVWTGEIADANGRVALLVARFDLKRWLNGEMLHTTFITSPQDMIRGYCHWQVQECDKRCLKDLKTALEKREVPETSWDQLCQILSQLDDGQQGKRTWIEALGSLSDKRRAYLGLQDKKQRWSDEIASPDTHPGKKADLERRLEEVGAQISSLEAELRALEVTLTATPTLETAVYHHMTRYRGKKERTGAIAKQLEEPYGLDAERALLLALARKNPSASRLLRVWQTTAKFLKHQADEMGERPAKEKRQRAVFALADPPRTGIYTAEVPGLGRTELFVRPDGKAQTISYLEESRISAALRDARARGLQLTADGRGQPLKQSHAVVETSVEPYLPYQVITVSPNLLLAMLPADQAMEVVQQMQEAYAEEFGKVQGRLPFHVGLIFMDAHYPMFAALDTARRLAESFDHVAEGEAQAHVVGLQRGKDGVCTLTLKDDRFGTWTWQVQALRVDRETDWYHPYFLVREGKNLEERGMSLQGPEGQWVHVSQLQKGDRIAFWPNLFDFLFLDTVSRRLEAHVPGEANRRPHPLLGQQHSPRPYLLKRAAGLRELWEMICKVEGMSETRLEACSSLLARKWKAWVLASGDAAEQRQTYDWLADETVNRDLGQNQTIRDAIDDGTFFDVVELYRHILKQKVESA